jgi:hypothetical protein
VIASSQGERYIASTVRMQGDEPVTIALNASCQLDAKACNIAA